MATPTENDAYIVLGVLVQAEIAAEAAGDVDQISAAVSGDEIQSRTELTPPRINRAVGLLEGWGWAGVLRTFGTRPFEFRNAQVTPVGRLEWEQAQARGEERASGTMADNSPSEPTSTRIFIVHGRDEASREHVARTIERLGLDPLILMDEPNQGRTLVEKFEDKALDVGFAVILMTPDDVGYSGGDAPPDGPNRARQNVVLELGYFMGSLGRSRVAALYRQGVELPSDIHGLGYIQFDGEGAWRYKLAEELAAAGYDIDFNRLRR